MILDISQASQELRYSPGDHLAVLPANNNELVEGIIKRLTDVQNPDEPNQLMIMKEHHTPNGW